MIQIHLWFQLKDESVIYFYIHPASPLRSNSFTDHTDCTVKNAICAQSLPKSYLSVIFLLNKRERQAKEVDE